MQRSAVLGYRRCVKFREFYKRTRIPLRCIQATNCTLQYILHQTRHFQQVARYEAQRNPGISALCRIQGILQKNPVFRFAASRLRNYILRSPCRCKLVCMSELRPYANQFAPTQDVYPISETSSAHHATLIGAASSLVPCAPRLALARRSRPSRGRV